MSWETKWKGVIWVGQQSIRPNGAIFEKVSRSPGSRLILVRDNKVLLSQEKRAELGDRIDHRLPGGKVFDTNQAYQEHLTSGQDILEASRESAAKEALEEVGLIIDPVNFTYIGTDILGATCSWDLIYWACDEFSEHSKGAQFHETEADEIQGAVWVPIIEACRMALDESQFSESRSALALIRYAQKNGLISL